MQVPDNTLDSQETYEEGYGTVLDSGTTFTYLPTEAFRAFRDAVTAFATGKGLKMTKGPDPKFYDICFGGAPHVEHADQLEHVFPHLDLQFKGVRSFLISFGAPAFGGRQNYESSQPAFYDFAKCYQIGESPIILLPLHLCFCEDSRSIV